MNFDSDFKKALELLPSEEKDKLILRLLKRDLVLANRLQFELVSTESIEDKRKALQQKIQKTILRSTERFYSCGYLLMDIRSISADITEHVTITKDKHGEIILNCKMLYYLLELNNNHIKTAKFGKAYTLCIYIVARVFRILIQIQKLHEDLHLEFRNDIEKIGELISKNDNIMKVAISNQLDVNWLLYFDIQKI